MFSNKWLWLILVVNLFIFHSPWSAWPWSLVRDDLAVRTGAPCARCRTDRVPARSSAGRSTCTSTGACHICACRWTVRRRWRSGLLRPPRWTCPAAVAAWTPRAPPAANGVPCPPILAAACCTAPPPRPAASPGCSPSDCPASGSAVPTLSRCGTADRPARLHRRCYSAANPRSLHFVTITLILNMHFIAMFTCSRYSFQRTRGTKYIGPYNGPF